MSIHTPKAEKMDTRRYPPQKIGVMHQTRAEPLPGMQVSPSTQESHNIPWVPPPEDHISGMYDDMRGPMCRLSLVEMKLNHS